MINNSDFLLALFGADAPWVHVTDFIYDPMQIPDDKRLLSWMGDYFSRYNMQGNSNQYFTISNFYCDEQGQARRRKALFRHTPVIVLDDVKEKLAMTEVLKLPAPSWILETSPGSEQWGYILDTPCTDRSVVENLLDGLVANGLAPDGKDPGMKGVTRYVRLPDGINNKGSKLVNGQPFKCRLTAWQPFNRVTIEQLAQPFGVNLNAVRRESRTDGASAVNDHPILATDGVISVKEIRSDGRFDITCPWVNDHTGVDDSGSAVFTNSDGSIGFKCHHGACQGRTGKDLLEFIDRSLPGFSSKLKNWQIMREFSTVSEPSFFSEQLPAQTQEVSFMGLEQTSFMAPKTEKGQEVDGLQTLCNQLMMHHSSTKEARDIASAILRHSDDMPTIDRREWHNKVADLMSWNKSEIKDILKDLRSTWYGERVSTSEFYDNIVFIKELNQFYEWSSRIFYSTMAFQNSYSHEEAEALKIALQEGRVEKVDKIDYAPKFSRIFTENGTVYANTWTDQLQDGLVNGDVKRWWDHFDSLGWADYRKHIIQWMAFTLRHPDQKINHMLLLGSREGTGKDFLLYPLIHGMGHNCTVVAGEELTRNFDDHLLSTKYLHINEAELGDRHEAIAISNKLKPLAAAPPDTLRVNQKGLKPINVRNIVNATITTNSTMPLRLNGPSRRFLCLWSELNVRDENDNMRADWNVYWQDRWDWMKAEGWKNVAHHLINDVDLSDFNPNEAPPMTDFLRDITDSSKSPAQQTIEAFIQKGHGAFRCDLATASDLAETLRGDVFALNDMFTDNKIFTPTKTGMILKDITSAMHIKVYRKSVPIRLWVIRNKDRYNSMAPDQIYNEYERQMNEARGAAHLRLVEK
jgi:hypothetical protein